MTNLGPSQTIRVQLPYHLRTLAGIKDAPGGELTIEVTPPPTVNSVMDAVEARYPTLSGTMRDHVTRKRRPFLRFFACGEDISHDPQDAPLPAAIASGAEPLLLIGAISGG